MSTLWIVRTLSTPCVLRPCKNCGVISAYHSSGKFRVNGNAHLLDVWLIYKCEWCDTTWKLTILTRVPPSSIQKPLFEAYTHNDPDTARACAFDRALLSRSGAQPKFDAVEFTVDGDIPSPPCEITISTPYAMDIRLIRVIAKKLGVSRSEAERMAAFGELTAGGDDIRSLKLKPNQTITWTCRPTPAP